jgi:hypothetical protein
MFRTGAIALVMTTFAGCAHAQSAPFTKPDVIRYGATVADTQAALAGRCTSMVTRPINPPFAPNVQRVQLQIDCDGFDFFGAPRWAEFVFRDDSLEMVWIMVRPEDQDAIVVAIAQAYGPPSSRNEAYIAFAQGDIAWRHHPSEVLFYSPEFSEWTEAWFD